MVTTKDTIGKDTITTTEKKAITTKKDDDTHRVGFLIPESLYQRAKKFNERSDRPIKFDRIFIRALTAELDRAEKEVQ